MIHLKEPLYISKLVLDVFMDFLIIKFLCTIMDNIKTCILISFRKS